MALPNLLLREFRTEAISGLIPGKVAQTYQQLEKLAFGIFAKEPDQWSVHFHLEDNECEGKALPFLWDSGGYFDESCLKSGKLHVFAHFESTRVAKSNHRRRHTTNVSLVQEVNNEGRPNVPSSPLSILDEIGLPVGAHERPMLQVKHEPVQSRKRARVQDLSSESESEYSLGAIVDEEDDMEDEDSEQHSLQPLPAGATVEQHDIDLEAFRRTNAPRGIYGHKENWGSIGNDYRRKVARARLIEGKYGAPAPVACDNCLNKGIKCRVYHPDLGLDKSSGANCGECRQWSRTCIMDAAGGRERNGIAQKKRKRQSLPTTDFHGIEEGTFLCPVASCSRSGEPFIRHDNWRRHIISKHPGTEVPEPLNTNKKRRPERVSRSITILESDIVEVPKPNPLACPVRGCKSKAAQGFSRLENLHTHCRTQHPELDPGLPTSENAERLQPVTSTPAGVQIIRSAEVRKSKGTPMRHGANHRRTQYFCPVTGCDHVGGFTPYHNLQRHVIAKHPKFSLENKEPASTKIGHSSTVQAQLEPLARTHPVQMELFNQHSSGGKKTITLPFAPNFEEFASDWKKAMRTNSLPGEYAYHDQWDDLDTSTRTKYVGARLMKGKYGVNAPEPCSNCLCLKVNCRVYHPDLPRDQGRYLGFACGQCKMTGLPCDVNKAPFDGYTILRAPTDEKTNLHGSAEETEGAVMDDVLANQTSVTRARSGLFCPVQSCPSRDLPAFTRYFELQRHIRMEHPESNHALVLEAVYNNKPLVLHPPPPKEEFLADEKLYAMRNAAPGEFGHRPSYIWDSVQQITRGRIAHARLIQEKYGVIAPQPCKGCQNKETTCIVYHPDMVYKKNATYCGECKDKSVMCHMSPSPFEPYLQHAKQNGRHMGSNDTTAGARRSFGKANDRLLRREIPDSDDLEVKLEDIEYDQENREERGEPLGSHVYDLGSTPLSSQHGDYDTDGRGDAISEVPSPNYSDYPEFYDDEDEVFKETDHNHPSPTDLEPTDLERSVCDNEASNSAPPSLWPATAAADRSKDFESAPPPSRPTVHFSAYNRSVVPMSPEPNDDPDQTRNDASRSKSASPLPQRPLHKSPSNPSNPSDEQDYRHYTKYSDQAAEKDGPTTPDTDAALTSRMQSNEAPISQASAPISQASAPISQTSAPISQASAPTPAQESAESLDPRAVQIFGKYINAPVLVPFYSRFPQMSNGMMKSLYSIVDLVPAARTDMYEFKKHLLPQVYGPQGIYAAQAELISHVKQFL